MKILPRIMQQQPRSQGLFQAREKTLGTRLMQQTPHIKEKAPSIIQHAPHIG